MLTLNQELVRAAAASPTVSLPPPALFELPEKVLQFGTGVLLRGLPDFLIDQANRQGLFNGRVVVVKSTDGGGDAAAFERQDNLYTVCVRGIEDEQPVRQDVVCASLSRVLSAKSQWAEVLEFAARPDLQVVLSNTTEVGIVLDADDDVRAKPPRSFPGKLLAVLLARYEAFCGAIDKGLVIVPTELIPDNGTKLRGILRELAENQVPDVGFLTWLEKANTICNSLVDRIVPGKPEAAAGAALAQELGYEDELLTMSEVYALWAIEGDERVRQVLSFQPVHPGIIVQPDINQFKELKLRLLNGTHSLASGLAVLSGVPTVRGAMEDENLLTYIRHLMLADLLPGIPYPIDEKIGQRFGMQVLDRFRNPAVEHRWLAITLNYSAKLRMRVVPDLLHYAERFRAVPQYVALGFAAYLLFMRNTRHEGDKWYGEANGQEYLIQDEQAGLFAERWATASPADLVRQVLSDLSLWGTDLTALPGFNEAVTRYLLQMAQEGAAATLAAKLNKTARAVV
ncbi:tagaturonate reductase [Hymenobacter ginsengisoli]|uniref:Tagaturonate reductase n=1 Tax=Hymenobacter ginsengisoli TaxID=1051626 RepID=A0ABP8QPJ3_9BACT|nr:MULTISPECIES: tagaturonate reductase [unclassified Hymenobacter]MBO2033987.1 tagaturonate reductase [Hymenobacter sp. BT559]